MEGEKDLQLKNLEYWHSMGMSVQVCEFLRCQDINRKKQRKEKVKKQENKKWEKEESEKGERQTGYVACLHQPFPLSRI